MADLLRALGHDVTGPDRSLPLLAPRRRGKGGSVSDLGLPDGNSHDLMREISRRCWLEAIAISGYGDGGGRATQPRHT